MGKATLPILGAVAGTVVLPGIGTAIGAGLGAAATGMTQKANTPAPAAAPVAAPIAPADPNLVAATKATDTATLEQQRRRSLGLNTIMSDPTNSQSGGSGVTNYG